ncbi:MAG: hypothetical protein ACK52H_07535 [Burkholderiales bacterium]
MNRVTIWWIPKADASAIMAQAIAIEVAVVQCSKRKNKCFIGPSLHSIEKRPPASAGRALQEKPIT